MDPLNTAPQKKKIGSLCSYVPEELIMAAGFDSIRIQGRVEKVGDAHSYLSPNFCPYLNNLLDSGLNGKLSDIEGIVFTNSCDGMRRLYDVWDHYLEIPFLHMLEVPKRRDENAISYFSEQLLALKRRLEEAFNVRISDDRLWEAISLVNGHRLRIMELFEEQKESHPVIKGSEMLSLCLKEITSSKNETARERMTPAMQPGSGNPTTAEGPRLLVVGNIVDRLNLFQVVEGAGASVVAFDTCAGWRHFSGLVEKSHDPINSMARRYLLKPPCSRMPGFSERLDYLKRLIADYSVDGIIYSCLKFCDYGMFEAPQLENSLGDSSVPCLVLESDYVWGDEGRLKTRIEAFIEMING